MEILKIRNTLLSWYGSHIQELENIIYNKLFDTKKKRYIASDILSAFIFDVTLLTDDKLRNLYEVYCQGKSSFFKYTRTSLNNYVTSPRSKYNYKPVGSIEIITIDYNAKSNYDICILDNDKSIEKQIDDKYLNERTKEDKMLDILESLKDNDRLGKHAIWYLKELYMMNVVDGYSYAQISRIKHISASTIRNNVCKFKNYIEDLFLKSK